jgi:16S rRNA (uracil1498-N3)-methyltransferase
MPHFYVKPEDITGNIFSIKGEQAHYVFHVRRLKPEDEIMIFDGVGNSYKAKINSVNKTEIIGNIVSCEYKIPGFVIKLYTAIPKFDRFEWLIEKCAEIGVSEIFPINAKRSVNANLSKNKAKRYEKISIAASSQCARNDIMKINSQLDFKAACRNAEKDKNFINILPWENESKMFVCNLPLKSKFTGANIFIGPEGGFENEEVEFAKSMGVNIVTLGDNILRVETAAVVVSALVLNFYNA